jgi:hypothetical protein
VRTVKASALTSSTARCVMLAIVLAAVGAVLLATNPAVAREPEWTVQCISDQHGGNQGSYLSGNRALYFNVSLQGSSLIDSALLYDLTTGQTSRLTDPAVENARGAGISGDRVVWAGQSVSDWTDIDLICRDLTAGTQHSLTEGATYMPDRPSFGGNLIAYAALDSVGGGVDVFVRDLTTDTVRNVTDSGFTLTEIWDTLTDGRWIVIEQLPESGVSAGGVFVVDWQAAAGAAPRRIEEVNASTLTSLALGGGLLVWSDIGGGVSCLDLATGVSNVISSGAGGPVATDGTIIAWAEWDEAADASRIRVMDKSGAALDDVPLLQPIVVSLAVQGDRVLYSAATDREMFTDAEVYLATRRSVFLDVGAGHPYRTAIEDLYRAGVIAGYAVPGGAEFRPEAPVWRAQFAKMADIILEAPVNESLDPPFTDMGPDDPASLYPHEYVTVAYKLGITTGLTATTFGPYEDITRAQAITMIVRAAQLRPGLLASPPAGYMPAVPPFSAIHDTNLAIAEYNGLLTGLQGYGASWDPWASATRAEVAQMLNNLRRALFPPA